MLISLAVLLAAGVAVYENPQVRQWVDESRRKVAIALHNLGDELAPSSEESRSSRQDDASTREDDSPEAVERRRQARQEILERGRRLEEVRRAREGSGSQGQSFHDFVDQDGTLRPRVEGQGSAMVASQTTATDAQDNELGLRHRKTEAKAAAFGSRLANPFADEMQMDTFPLPSPDRVKSPPLPPKPAAYLHQQQAPVEPQVSRDSPLTETETISNHPSEHLVDLTPTTSAPGFPVTPVSTMAGAIADLAELRPPIPPRPQAYSQPQVQPQPELVSEPSSSSTPSSYLSTNDWAISQSQRLDSQLPPPPPLPQRQPSQSLQQAPTPSDLERAMSDFLSQSSHSIVNVHEHEHEPEPEPEHENESAPSEIDSRYGVLSHDGFTTDNDSDEEGEAGRGRKAGIRTPSTWTDVGSQVSEDF